MKFFLLDEGIGGLGNAKLQLESLLGKVSPLDEDDWRPGKRKTCQFNGNTEKTQLNRYSGHTIQPFLRARLAFFELIPPPSCGGISIIRKFLRRRSRLARWIAQKPREMCMFILRAKLFGNGPPWKFLRRMPHQK